MTKKDFSNVGKQENDTIAKIVSTSKGKGAEQPKEKKDQRLTLAIRKSAMQDLKNLTALKQTTLNNYVNELIEADMEKNRVILDQFNKFAEGVE